MRNLFYLLIAFFVFSCKEKETKSTTNEAVVETPSQPVISPMIGGKAPGFTLFDKDGKEVSLSQFKGKYVLIDFWASWCGPCKAEIPFIKKAYEMYKSKNFMVLGVSADKSPEPWLNALDGFQMNWPNVIDPKDLVGGMYQIEAYPTPFLVNPEGLIVEKGDKLRHEGLLKVLDAYIK